MTEAMVSANGVELCVQTFGAPTAPALLLIAGAASSMDLWDPGFCRRLADGGRYVVRYDHRDTGGSVSYPRGRPGYSGADLVADAAALVDRLAGGRAHLVGLSMGAAIAQALAVAGPDRVATLTLLSGSPGGPGPDNGLPPIADRLRAVFTEPAPEPDWSDRDAVVDHLVEGERAFAAPAFFDEAAVRAAARRTVGRTADPATAANHWVADGGDDDPRPRLGELRVPTLVIHGSADPFFPLGHGQALAREIRGARLLVLDGVGHQPPPPATWDIVVPAILRHTAG